MARTVLTNAYIKIGSTDFSDLIASIEFSDEAEEISTTAFGDTGQRRVGGLRDQSVSLDFHVDFDPAEVDATIGALVGGTVAIEFAPKGTAIGTANPKFGSMRYSTLSRSPSIAALITAREYAILNRSPTP
jgi:hypothetical protein